MDSSGWLVDIKDKADRLMAYYITSDFSQSFLYEGSVTSLPYHIQLFENNPSRLSTEIETSLKIYLSRYFDRVDIKVTVDNLDGDYSDKLNIQIQADVYEGEYKYDLGREIITANNKIVKVFNLINKGF